MGMNILVLFTCFNRKEKTLTCIHTLKSDKEINFTFIVADDNSGDGTAEALKKIENVTVLNGDGKLFYSGGMRMTIDYARKQDLSSYQYVMFINDDVEFFEKAITKLISQSPNRDQIVIGSMCDDNGKLSYGGSIHTSRFKPSYKTVMSEQEKVYCDTFCANCVLIPTEIFKALPNIDTTYQHAMGDFDYGWTASKLGIKILASDFFVGKCNDNPINGTWRDTSLSIKERLKLKESPKGLPFKEYGHYLKKNHGTVVAVIYSMIPYVKIILKK